MRTGRPWYGTRGRDVPVRGPMELLLVSHIAGKVKGVARRVFCQMRDSQSGIVKIFDSTDRVSKLRYELCMNSE